MTGPIGPGSFRVGRLLGLAHALVEVGAQGVAQNRFVDVAGDMESRRALVLLDVEHVVAARGLHGGEVEPIGLVAALGMDGAAVPSRGRGGEDLRVACGVDQGILRSGNEIGGGIEARLGIPNNRDLLRSWEIAELIHDDDGHIAGRCGAGGTARRRGAA